MPSGNAHAKYGFQFVLGFLTPPDRIIPTFCNSLARAGMASWSKAPPNTPRAPNLWELSFDPHMTRVRFDEVMTAEAMRGVNDATAHGERVKMGGRLYLVGHGSWYLGTLGNYHAEDIAYMIGKLFPMSQIKLVSVVSCNLGRYRVADDPGLANESSESFSAKLHRFLGKGGPDVHAYTKYVTVSSGPGVLYSKLGEKQTSPIEKPKNGFYDHHRLGSKVLFRWNGEAQVRTVVKYQNRRANTRLPPPPQPAPRPMPVFSIQADLELDRLDDLIEMMSQA